MSTLTGDKLITSVLALLKVASYNSSGSDPAASVLLSAYNSYEFCVRVDDLCLLDEENYFHAMNVIHARYQRIEPHELIKDGDEVFRLLSSQFQHLRQDRK